MNTTPKLATNLAIGDVVTRDIINRIDPRYGQTYLARIVSIRETGAWLEFSVTPVDSDLRDHMGNPYGGAFTVAGNVDIDVVA